MQRGRNRCTREAPTCGCIKWARRRGPVSGLFFTGSCATAADSADTGIEIGGDDFCGRGSAPVLHRSGRRCCGKREPPHPQEARSAVSKDGAARALMLRDAAP